MIDMVFLLLVFFMCISHLSTAPYRIELDLPTTIDPGDKPDDSSVIQLTMDAHETLYINGAVVPKQELTTTLELSRSQPLATIHLRFDRSLSWECSAEIIQMVAAAGYDQLAILSNEADS